MTEAEWLSGDNTGAMLEHLNPDEEARKTRLFKCACCYLMWPLLTDERSRCGVETAERFVDGAATNAEMKHAVAGAEEAAAHAAQRRRGQNEPKTVFAARKLAAEHARNTATNRGFWAVGLVRWIRLPKLGRRKPDPAFPRCPMPVRPVAKTDEELYRWVSALVRCIFGNPFRPVAFDPAWRTSDAVALARSMYDSRDFGAMPILADALQDAGCDSEQVLNHCRDANAVHVRGCWVCDLVLGKQ